MPAYRIGRLKGRFVLVWHDEQGQRHRHRLDAKDARGAAIEAPGIFAILNKPKGRTVAELWNAYITDHAGRAVTANMAFNWKAMRERFGSMDAGSVTVEDCRAHTAERKRAKIKPGTIATELGRLRMVLRWAEKKSLISKAPAIERPTPPKRREQHLTREECRALIGSAGAPHLRLYIILALATAARNSALLELTWDRCDFARQKIDLRNPSIDRPHKGRAIVPMNRTARAALLEAQAGALTDYVVEWAGNHVLSVKRGLKAAAGRAGITATVSPHILRHSAAVHMAEAGIPMEEIAQYLGHEDVSVTRKVYARFSPSHLRGAAAVLEYDEGGSMNQMGATFSGEKAPEMPGIMVRATGIEPVTPTMTEEFEELIIDSFAGGGGTSEGIVAALGRDPRIQTILSIRGRQRRRDRTPVGDFFAIMEGAMDAVHENIESCNHAGPITQKAQTAKAIRASSDRSEPGDEFSDTFGEHHDA